MNTKEIRQVCQITRTEMTYAFKGYHWGQQLDKVDKDPLSS